MAAPTKQQLDQRAAELDEQEQQLADQATELEHREQQLDQRNADVDAVVLPAPPPDRARIVVDVDADLVPTINALHPSEQLSVNAQLNGALRQILLASGHRPRRILIQAEGDTRPALSHLPSV